MRPLLFAILLVVLPNLLMLPLENQIHTESQQLRYGGQPVTRELRDQIGQGMAIALLAGFRGIAADFIAIRGHDYWEKRLWFKQYECLESTVKLQPQSVFFWDVGAWHMAWNIAYAERIGTNDTSVAKGINRERLWHDRARAFLERGVQNIPNRYNLYYKLGCLYQRKLALDCGGDDACTKERYRQAAGYFDKAATFDTAPSYVARDAAHCLESAGDVQGAYEYWRKIYDQGAQKRESYSRPIIQREIRRLEEVLAIPDNERMFPKHPVVKPAAS